MITRTPRRRARRKPQRAARPEPLALEPQPPPPVEEPFFEEMVVFPAEPIVTLVDAAPVATLVEAPSTPPIAAYAPPQPAPGARTVNALSPVPSIREQTPWPLGFYAFPYRHKVQYFNPALVEWQGYRYLVARRRRTFFRPGKNDIVFWLLEGDKPILEKRVIIPAQHASQHWEDPRINNVNGRLWLAFATFRSPWRSNFVHQSAGWLNGMLQMTDPQNIAFGGNATHEITNTANEKNWVWFFPGGAPHFVYSPSPHVVVRVDGVKPALVHETPGFMWDYGLPRGGTPPVLVGDLYWSFFHSSIDISPKPPRRRYYMGAYAFSAEPPFAPVLYTRTPLLTGSERDFREPSAPYCVFPCGALLDAGTWHVTLGVNDIACAWLRVPHAELLARCSRVAPPLL